MSQTDLQGPRSWQDLPGAPAPGTLLASLSEIEDGGALLRDFAGGMEKPFRVLLLRSGAKVFAYVNRCAHFGVPLAAKVDYLGLKPHESFRCSVHAARYRWQDGQCIFGDCEGESLLRIPVTVDGEKVLISTTSA